MTAFRFILFVCCCYTTVGEDAASLSCKSAIKHTCGFYGRSQGRKLCKDCLKLHRTMINTKAGPKQQCSEVELSTYCDGLGTNVAEEMPFSKKPVKGSATEAKELCFDDVQRSCGKAFLQAGTCKSCVKHHKRILRATIHKYQLNLKSNCTIPMMDSFCYDHFLVKDIESLTQNTETALSHNGKRKECSSIACKRLKCVAEVKSKCGSGGLSSAQMCGNRQSKKCIAELRLNVATGIHSNCADRYLVS